MENSPKEPQSPPPATTAEDYLADAERRRKVERELIAMGVSADEIRRLMNADAFTVQPKETSPSASSPLKTLPKTLPVTPLPAPQKKKKNQRVTAEDLQSFAADLTAKHVAKETAAQTAAIEVAMKDLPEFRESTAQERSQSAEWQREAASLKKREKYGEAVAKCQQALALTPKDALCLELLGDLLQDVAQIDGALAAYKRATLADPRRASAEKKYGDLLVQQQNLASGYDPEEVPSNPLWAGLLSMLLPGVGQFYNRDWLKGAFIIGLLGACYLLRETTRIPNSKRLDASTTLVVIVAGVIYIAGVIDAIQSAKRQPGSRGRGGWDV